MSEHIDEKLSVFMDGELGRDEARFLLRRVEHEPSQRARWTRYHVIRQALRRQEIVVLREDFASGILARLDDAHAVRSARGTWLRWGSGGAIAAAVAVTALMVTKPVSEPASTPITVARAPQAASTAPTQLASANPVESRTQPLVPNSPIQTAAASFGTDLVEPASFDPRMQSYLIRHYQATGSTGQPDVVPYILLPPAQAAPRPENR